MVRWLKYWLVVFAAFFGGVGVVCGSGKGLPTVVFEAEDIWFTGLGCWDVVDGFEGCNDNPVINVVKRGLVHFPVLFHQPTFALFQLPVVQQHHLFFNTGDANFRTGIEYPFLDCVPCDQINPQNLRVCAATVGKFTNYFTGVDYLRGKPHAVRVHILNYQFKGIAAVGGQYPFKYGNRFFIKTSPDIAAD